MRHLLVRSGIIAGSLFMLTGCYAGSLSTLQESNPQATDFPSALAAEYLGYSQSEYEQNHFISANYFAHKGLEAEHGKDVEPDAIDGMLPDQVKQQLTSSRELLMTLLTPKVKQLAPQEAARAQLLFDCWQRQHGGGSEKAPCADEFQSAITDLQDAAEMTAPGKATAYTIAFAAKNATLSAHAQAQVKSIASRLSWRSKYRITLEGYSGPSDELHQLSEKQMAAVQAALTSRGVVANRIHLPKPAAAKPVVLKGSDDGVQEQNKNQIKITVVKFDSNAVADSQSPVEAAQ
jgi:OOP family OmpA-OmpF porin